MVKSNILFKRVGNNHYVVYNKMSKETLLISQPSKCPHVIDIQ